MSGRLKRLTIVVLVPLCFLVLCYVVGVLGASGHQIDGGVVGQMLFGAFLVVLACFLAIPAYILFLVFWYIVKEAWAWGLCPINPYFGRLLGQLAFLPQKSILRPVLYTLVSNGRREICGGLRDTSASGLPRPDLRWLTRYSGLAPYFLCGVVL